MLLLALLATAPQWSVTFETSRTVDHGNGVKRGHQSSKSVLTSTDADVKKRDEVAALLPRLPQAATYSMSDFVDDEASYDETLTVEQNGKQLVFALVQGKQAPAMPKALAELRAVLKPALK